MRPCSRAIPVRVTFLTVVLLLAVTSRGAESPAQTATGQDVPAKGPILPEFGNLKLPASFLGDLPCADCEAIRYHLDLQPDGSYQLRREMVGRNLIDYAMGRWSVDIERHALVLQGDREPSLQFEIRSPDHLRQLDIEGRPIESSLPYELVSNGVFVPMEVSLPMGGELSFDNDVLHYTECLSGSNLRVAKDAGDYDLALRACQKRNGGYVTILGTMRDGRVFIDRFVHAWPNETCERSRAAANLINTYWRFEEIDGEHIRVGFGTKEPHIIFHNKEQHISYSSTMGCNTMDGGVTISGEDMVLKGGVSTQIECPEKALEARFSDAVQRVRHWKIIGNTLMLTDESGEPVILLEAVYL